MASQIAKIESIKDSDVNRQNQIKVFDFLVRKTWGRPNAFKIQLFKFQAAKH